MTAAIVPEFEEPDFDTLERAAEWIEHLSGPHALEKRAAFDAWLAERPAHEYAYAEMRSLREAVAPTAQMTATRERQETALRRQRVRRRIDTVAATAAVLGLGLAWGPDLALRMQADAMTRPGDMEQVSLVDGSRIALNTGSAISTSFASGKREVRLLKGEAFFDVARDPSRPFVITAGDSRIRVLGTHFNVRMDGARTTVTVAHGRVSFGPISNPAAQILLTDGQQAFSEGTSSQRQPVYDQNEALAWRRGRMIFYRKPVRDVIAEIARYRSGNVLVLSSGLGARTISGTFSTRTPDLALTNVARTIGARVLDLPGGITIIYD
ncbi:FecR family protein [Sphingomonas sp.]|uniref:FecR family protein n=1 Tax=Sphingomonas sp. TaxID=28214 RepID=UPI0025F1597C|nr:FecR family protein [Sphingomonas sp.]